MLISNKSTQKKVVLITGASRGLGLEILRQLIKDGNFHVIATARAQSLERFSEENIFPSQDLWLRPLDILIKAERDTLIREVTDEFGGVDILINNAGYMLRAVVEHVGEIERFKQMDTNFRAPMALIRGILPGMRAKKFGRVINISSVGGMMAMPTMAVYSASKFALEGASESLWYEVRPWNIRVTLIQPGFINSSSYENVKNSKESEASQRDEKSPYHLHYRSMIPFVTKLMKYSQATPEKVANVVLKTIKSRHPPLRVAGTFDAHIFYLIRRILPRRAYHMLLYYSLPKILKWGKS